MVYMQHGLKQQKHTRLNETSYNSYILLCNGRSSSRKILLIKLKAALGHRLVFTAATGQDFGFRDRHCDRHSRRRHGALDEVIERGVVIVFDLQRSGQLDAWRPRHSDGLRPGRTDLAQASLRPLGG